MEKRLKVGTQPDVVTVSGKTIMQVTCQDPIFLASVNLAAPQANADNIGKLIEDAGHYKEKIRKMKNTLVKERKEGGELNRKHEETLSEFERLQKSYQDLELGKDALVVLLTTT